MSWRGSRPLDVQTGRPYVCLRLGRWMVLCSPLGAGGHDLRNAAAAVKCTDHDDAQQVARQWAGFLRAWDTEVSS